MPHKLLIKNTLQYEENNWHVGRFLVLYEQLEAMTFAFGQQMFEVIASDRIINTEGDDPELTYLPESDYEQLWLLATDGQDCLTKADISGIMDFRRRGGTCLVMPGQQDIARWQPELGPASLAHHRLNQELDETRGRGNDLLHGINGPDYRSGPVGSYQHIATGDPPHPIVQRKDGSAMQYLPSHPYEGVINLPEGAEAYGTIVATGISKPTQTKFNLGIAFDFEGDSESEGPILGRAYCASSFHHFADYNFDPAAGCPDFVEEEPVHHLMRKPEAFADALLYPQNIARWLAGMESV